MNEKYRPENIVGILVDNQPGTFFIVLNKHDKAFLFNPEIMKTTKLKKTHWRVAIVTTQFDETNLHK